MFCEIRSVVWLVQKNTEFSLPEKLPIVNLLICLSIVLDQRKYIWKYSQIWKVGGLHLWSTYNIYIQYPKAAFHYYFLKLNLLEEYQCLCYSPENILHTSVPETNRNVNWSESLLGQIQDQALIH